MANHLDLSALEIGVSHGGMQTYKEDLKTIMLTTLSEKIDDTEEMIKALQDCWQGEAETNFENQFANVRESIKQALSDEYYDFEARMTELEDAYFRQDHEMVEADY